jgi:hypothetical protein
MKPMPTGRVGDFGREVLERRVRAVWRSDSRDEVSVPAAMKPMPPVRGLVGAWGWENGEV